MRLVKGVKKAPLLNELFKLIIPKLFLGGTAPSSPFSITQPLMALGISRIVKEKQLVA